MGGGGLGQDQSLHATLNESNVESGGSIQKADVNVTSFSDPKEYETPHHMIQQFRTAFERRRRISDDKSGVNDVLTPTLKVVNQSSASLHQFYNHPMLTIQEEDWPTISSRKSSLKSQNPTYNEHKSSDHSSILPVVDPSIGLDPSGPIAEAVAYIAQKAVTLEDLRVLEETLKKDAGHGDQGPPT